MFAQDKVDLCILQANMYRAERRFSEASELLGRAVKVNPEFPAAWMNMGIVQASLGHYQVGIQVQGDRGGRLPGLSRLRLVAFCHPAQAVGS